MKTSEVRFRQLQKFLENLGFSEVRDQQGWVFRHTSSKAVFHFRPYRSADRVYEHDLFLVRSQLNGRGLITEEAFDSSMTKAPA
jgi:hypothetical protein